MTKFFKSGIVELRSELIDVLRLKYKKGESDMEKLKKLVCELEKEFDREKEVCILQEISAKILTEYVLDVDGTIVEPLRVEAYYFPFNEQEKFDDPCAHKSTKKINNFGRLYFIEPRYGYPGVDLCLSLGEYYLSFLIKNSRIQDKLYKQVDLYERFENNQKDIESKNVLKHIDKKDEKVFFTSRVNISKSKSKFANELLAAVIEINNGIKYEWEKGYGKERMVVDYMIKNNIEPTFANIKDLIGYNSSKVKKIVENSKRGIFE